MTKKKERLTRLGLPAKSAKVMFAVTPTEKGEIREAARSRRVTVTDYLLQLHRNAYPDHGGSSFRQLTPEERARMIPRSEVQKSTKKGGKS